MQTGAPASAGKGGARRDAGFALLLVLWTLAFLALIGTQTLTLGHAALDLQGVTLWKTRLQTSADAAITAALFGVAVPHPQITGSAPNLDGISVSVRVHFESGRINPNNASQPLLSAFLATQGLPRDQAASIAALIYSWHRQGFKPPGGMCRSLGAPFHTLDDLSAIPGMTDDLLARLTPHLSFAQRALPTPQSPDPAIREALRRAGISGAADQESSSSSGPRLVMIDAEATHGAFRMRRHAEALLTPGERPVPWRLLRIETTSDAPSDMASGVADHS